MCVLLQFEWYANMHTQHLCRRQRCVRVYARTYALACVYATRICFLFDRLSFSISFYLFVFRSPHFAVGFGFEKWSAIRCWKIKTDSIRGMCAESRYTRACIACSLTEPRRYTIHSMYTLCLFGLSVCVRSRRAIEPFRKLTASRRSCILSTYTVHTEKRSILWTNVNAVRASQISPHIKLSECAERYAV